MDQILKCLPRHHNKNTNINVSTCVRISPAEVDIPHLLTHHRHYEGGGFGLAGKVQVVRDRCGWIDIYVRARDSEQRGGGLTKDLPATSTSARTSTFRLMDSDSPAINIALPPRETRLSDPLRVHRRVCHHHRDGSLIMYMHHVRIRSYYY
jgi:hypothetical protein